MSHCYRKLGASLSPRSGSRQHTGALLYCHYCFNLGTIFQLIMPAVFLMWSHIVDNFTYSICNYKKFL